MHHARELSLADVVPHGAMAFRSMLLGRPVTWSFPWSGPASAPARADRAHPIDVVYTWVDGTDPRWIAERDRWGSRTGAASHAHAASSRRFRDNDELRFSLRALEENVPFFRHLYIVTCGQVPAWLARAHPRLTVVHHADIFPDRSCLPTFNSDAIELHLWRIPGLAERFLYLNDDFFILRGATPDDFLDAQGRPRVFLTRRVSRFRSRGAEDVHYAGLAHTYARLAAVLGSAPRRVHAHVPIIQRRSAHEAIASLFADDLARTATHRFRHPTDLKVAFNVYPHFLLSRNLGTESSARWAHVQLRDDSRRNEVAFEILRGVAPTFMCLMDAMDDPSDECRRSARRNLAELLPRPSSFERS